MSFFEQVNDKLSKHKVLYKVLINLRNYAILIAMLVSYFVIGAMFTTDSTGLPHTTSTALFSIFVAVLSYIWYIGLKKDGKVKEADVKLSGKRFLIYIGEFILVAVGLLFMFSFIDIFIPDPTMASRTEYLSRLTGMDLGLYCLASCTVVPLAEECMMRLFLYNILNTGSHWCISMCVSSVIFAAIHGTISHMILATLFGIMMTIVYHNTGKWWISIVGHAIYNIITSFASTIIYSAASVPVVAILFFSFAVAIIIFEVVSGFSMSKKVK